MLDCSVKLADFGLTRELTKDDTHTIAQVGTKNYMAPEVFAGNRYAHDADIYSLGILLNQAGSLLGGWNLVSAQIQDLIDRMTSVT